MPPADDSDEYTASEASQGSSQTKESENEDEEEDNDSDNEMDADEEQEEEEDNNLSLPDSVTIPGSQDGSSQRAIEAMNVEVNVYGIPVTIKHTSLQTSQRKAPIWTYFRLLKEPQRRVPAWKTTGRRTPQQRALCSTSCLMCLHKYSSLKDNKDEAFRLSLNNIKYQNNGTKGGIFF